MAKKKRDSHDFFEESPIDPMAAATASDPNRRHLPGDASAAGQKQKAGFYLSRRILGRFNRKFHELKMEGRAIANKSALLEAALDFALDDIDRAADSKILTIFDESPEI